MISVIVKILNNNLFAKLTIKTTVKIIGKFTSINIKIFLKLKTARNYLRS